LRSFAVFTQDSRKGDPALHILGDSTPHVVTETSTQQQDTCHTTQPQQQHWSDGLAEPQQQQQQFPALECDSSSRPVQQQ